MNGDSLRAFLESNGSSRLVEIAHSRHVIDDDRRDAIYLALLDIAEAAEKVYRDIIPQIIDHPEQSDDELWELLFDLRAEFRHIDYHIHDAELDVLAWPKP
jgi:hypothetical protein